MSSDLVLMVGGLMSSLALGFAAGRFTKMIRQFFDSI